MAKYVSNLDLNLQELQNAVIQVLPADPEGGQLKEARFWYNSTDKALKFYNGTATRVLAVGSDLTTAVTRAVAAIQANVLMVSGGADRSAKSYEGGAGIIKSDANGAVSAAAAGVDYLTDSSTNTLLNKTFDANGTGNSLSNVEVADFAPSALANMLGSGTSSQLATADVIKAYVDTAVAGLGQLIPGGFDISSGALPTKGSGAADAIRAGDFWRITVAGNVAGLGHLEVGDALVAGVNDAAVAADFFVLQANITDAVTSDGNPSTANAIARFSGTTGRIVKNTQVTIDDSNNMNLPSGAEFRVNGANILAKNSRRHMGSFNDSTDWAGAAAPFTITVSAAVHGLGANQALEVLLRDTTGERIIADDSVDGSGNVTISANVKFAGVYSIIG